METVNRNMGAGEWALLILLSLLWGGSFFFIGVAVKAFPPFTLVTLRVGFAALALHIILRAKGLRLPGDRQRLTAFLGMGLLNNLLPFSLIVWGQTHIASGLAAIFNATTPLFTVILAHLFTRDEKLTGNRLGGIALGFTGVVLIIGPDSLKTLGTETLAQLAVLGAACSYACAGIFGRRFKRLGVPPLVTATGQVTATSLLMIPLALAVDHPWQLPLPGWAPWGAILGLALISTAFAYILYFRLLARAGATNLLLVTFLIPVSAILLGSTFLGEHLTGKAFAGMGLIGLGLAAIDGRLFGFILKRGFGSPDRPKPSP